MKMQHVTIQSRSLEESINFYEDVVGLKIVNEIKGGPMHIVFLSNGEGETCIELIDNPKKAYEGEGLSIGFKVKDPVGYQKVLAQKGFNPTPIISPNPKTSFFFVKDPNGVEIQFIG